MGVANWYLPDPRHRLAREFLDLPRQFLRLTFQNRDLLLHMLIRFVDKSVLGSSIPRWIVLCYILICYATG